MRGAPTSFWGKLQFDERGHPLAWHPLADHCADVAACCEALLERTLLRRRLALLAGLDDLTPAQCARLCVLAVLHDAGKVNLGFYAKADPTAPDRRGHVREIFALIAHETRVRGHVLAALGCEYVVAWGADRLLYAALAHHGEPITLSSAIAPSPQLWEAKGGLDPVRELAELARRARTWFPDAFSDAPPFPDAAPFQHAFSGLVTLADWIGSNTLLFPFAEDRQDRMSFARAAAARAVHALGLDAPGQRAALGACPGFADLFDGLSPRPAQAAVIELEPPRGGGLAVLEAETGSGKTEAAIARFFALFTAGEVDGMYFALPTRTAATQIHSRVAAAVKRAFHDEEARPPVVLAVPGYVRVDDVNGTKEEPRLAPFHVLWPEEYAERMRWRGWAAESPKRYLAGAVVVGTIDQVLLSSLPVKHAHLRATSLLRHLLVVDEVHASDAYMNRLLETVLERHLAAGGHALLMSATLGAVARERFLVGRRAELPSLADAEQVAYPNLAATGAGHRRQGARIHGAGHSKAVEVSPRPWMSDAREIAACALRAAKRGARVLVLRNTVRGAVETQLAVEALAGDDGRDVLFACRDVFAPHHSRFAREDRLRLDEAIENWLGKHGRSGGCVAIATQTVQQSLDLDTDLLLTDLCPADVLLQRIGRLHRHAQRPRPDEFERAQALLLVPRERDLGRFIRGRGDASGPHGIGTVYADLRVLEATWRLAEHDGLWRIPEMNRLLVERTTHPEALRRVAHELAGRWEEHATAVAGSGAAKTALAAVNAFDWRQPFGDRGFDPVTDARVSTRLGAGDRIARFAAPVASPFGEQVSALTLPAWLVSGADENAAMAEDVAVSVGTIRFRFGSREYLYDRLGLRRVISDSNDDEEDRADA